MRARALPASVPAQPADRDFLVAAFGVLLALGTLGHVLGGCGPPTAAAPPPFSTWDMLAALHLVKLMVRSMCCTPRVARPASWDGWRRTPHMPLLRAR